MNCQANREILINGDEQSPDWEPACTHLASCLACQGEFRKGTSFDRRLAELCQDVPVPLELEQQLLSQIAVTALAKRSTSALPLPDSQVIVPAKQAEIESEPASTRRRFLRRWPVAVAAVVCSSLSVAGYLAWQTSLQISLEQLVQAAAQDFPESQPLPQFVGFAHRVPLQLPQSLQVELDAATAKRIVVGRQVAAVFFFPVRTGQGEVVTGKLLVLPRRAISNPPGWEGFSAEAVDYVNHACAWREGDLVYVCSLDGSVEDLYRLFPPQQAG
jgi:hypothetical protein